MQLTIDELIQYTDGECAKWERWFSVQGNGPLKFRLAGETRATVKPRQNIIYLCAE